MQAGPNCASRFCCEEISQSTHALLQTGARMNPERVNLSKNHFHIRWSTGSPLDWEAFETRNEAEEVARQLACATEIYKIEEFDRTCGRCTKFWRAQLPDTKRKRQSTDMHHGDASSSNKSRKGSDTESVGS
jgi:hypothetical protein